MNDRFGHGFTGDPFDDAKWSDQSPDHEHDADLESADEGAEAEYSEELEALGEVLDGAGPEAIEAWIEALAADGEAGPLAPPPFDLPIDVMEVRGALVLRADLPGVHPRGVELAVIPGAIRIRASRRDRTPPGTRTIRRERPAGRVERVLPVPAEFDLPKLKARFDGGVLTVMVPRIAARSGSEGDLEPGAGAGDDDLA